MRYTLILLMIVIISFNAPNYIVSHSELLSDYRQDIFFFQLNRTSYHFVNTSRDYNAFQLYIPLNTNILQEQRFCIRFMHIIRFISIVNTSGLYIIVFKSQIVMSSMQLVIAVIFFLFVASIEQRCRPSFVNVSVKHQLVIVLLDCDTNASEIIIRTLTIIRFFC